VIIRSILTRPERRLPTSRRLWRSLALAGVAAGIALAPLSLPVTRAARVAQRAAAPTTITIWDIQTGIEQANLNAFAASFTKAHPNIRVQYQWFQNDPYKTKLTLAVGAHRGPDIFMGWGGGVLQSYVKSGAVADLTSAFNFAAPPRPHRPALAKPAGSGQCSSNITVTVPSQPFPRQARGTRKRPSGIV